MMMIVARAALCFVIATGAERLNESKHVCGSFGQCERNMHNIALTLLGYHQSTGSFPSGTVPNANLLPTDRLGVYLPASQ
jgi:Protein of unknown function (DUF1559)